MKTRSKFQKSNINFKSAVRERKKGKVENYIPDIERPA